VQVGSHADKGLEEAAGSSSRTPTHSASYIPTAPLLFRYSALTYNAHRIHYDRDWCKTVEGHPDLVVHGPLTATLLVELAEKIARDCGKQLRRFKYRATSPMYVDKEIRMDAMCDEGQSQLEMAAVQDGRVGMKATAMFE
jgi:hydroxyacyl-ACP dehydratase HTD2-like protein with hotdog domain